MDTITTSSEDMPLATAFQIVLGLAKESAFTKTQVGASPELNAVMQREQEALAIIEGFAEGEALAIIEGFAEGYTSSDHDGLPNEIVVDMDSETIQSSSTLAADDNA